MLLDTKHGAARIAMASKGSEQSGGSRRRCGSWLVKIFVHLDRFVSRMSLFCCCLAQLRRVALAKQEASS